MTDEQLIQQIEDALQHLKAGDENAKTQLADLLGYSRSTWPESKVGFTIHYIAKIFAP